MARSDQREKHCIFLQDIGLAYLRGRALYKSCIYFCYIIRSSNLVNESPG